MKFSYHVAVEREERLTTIATTIGFGKVVDTFYRKDKNVNEVRSYSITDTGVLIIKDESEKYLITAYAVRAKKLASFYKERGCTLAPSYLMQVARNNEKKRKYLFD